MNIVVKVLEVRLRKIVTVDNMQFSFMPGEGIINAIFKLV